MLGDFAPYVSERQTGSDSFGHTGHIGKVCPRWVQEHVIVAQGQEDDQNVEELYAAPITTQMGNLQDRRHIAEYLVGAVLAD